MGFGTALGLKRQLRLQTLFCSDLCREFASPFFLAKWKEKEILPGQRKEKHLLVGQVKQSDAGLSAVLPSLNQRVHFHLKKKYKSKNKRRKVWCQKHFFFFFKAQMTCWIKPHFVKHGLTRRCRGDWMG